jgi:MoaA/NifB/PqqE/SkfB family radical SAM enzyme
MHSGLTALDDVVVTELVPPPLSFIWLEITGRCQLRCRHCYADSGPHGTHGSMGTADWTRVIDQASDLGVSLVQYIGGEPTLHPDLQTLIQHTLDRRIGVEVYTNLVRVTDELWCLFEQPGVRLATSYYSPYAVEHNSITMRRSHDRTWANIREALRRHIPLRVGVVQTTEEHCVLEAVAELRTAGVTNISVDRLRQVGRGVRDQAPDIDQLCGRCGEAVLAVTPDGDAFPCVFSRWLSMGNVTQRSLAEIHAGAAEIRATLAQAFASRSDRRCPPNDGGCGGPNPCIPIIGAAGC